MARPATWSTRPPSASTTDTVGPPLTVHGSKLPSSKSSLQIASLTKPSPQGFGAFLASSGWKSQRTGSVRISTAATALVTWAQSSPVIGWPTRSAQDCSKASAASVKFDAGVRYADWARHQMLAALSSPMPEMVWPLKVPPSTVSA